MPTPCTIKKKKTTPSFLGISTLSRLARMPLTLRSLPLVPTALAGRGWQNARLLLLPSLFKAVSRQRGSVILEIVLIPRWPLDLSLPRPQRCAPASQVSASGLHRTAGIPGLCSPLTLVVPTHFPEEPLLQRHQPVSVTIRPPSLQ